jgi:hypothetical protein
MDLPGSTSKTNPDMLNRSHPCSMDLVQNIAKKGEIYIAQLPKKLEINVNIFLLRLIVYSITPSHLGVTRRDFFSYDPYHREQFHSSDPWFSTNS